MFYFDGIFTTKALESLFTSEFIKKIQNRQSGLVMKVLKGFNQQGSFLGSIHVNDNERVLFTIIQHQNSQRIVLLDHLFHKEYDEKLKNKKLLQQYLASKGVKLDLTQLDQQFEDPENNLETKIIKELFRTECLKKAAPVCFTRNRFIILSDAQEKAINLSQNNFVVGPPGSGKTVVLEEICRELCREENAEHETKHLSEYSEQCILLTPHISLAKRNASNLKIELSSNPWLRVLDLETLAREIDPELNALDKTLKRGIKDFIEWCRNPELGIQAKLKRRDTQKTGPIEPDILFGMLYKELKIIVTYSTKLTYLQAPIQNTLGSVFDNDEDARNIRFKIFVQYCNEALIGSHIPKDATVDPTATSGATQRAIVQDKPRGYDLSFYDLRPALQKRSKFKVLCLDEIQNFPRFALTALLSHAARIHIAGDSNQSLYDPLANLEFVRQCLFSAQHFEEHVFDCSYRSSEKIAVALTNLLKYQKECCSAVGNDKTAAKAIHTNPDAEKPVGYTDYCAITDRQAIEKYKLLCKDNPHYVIIIKDESERKEAEDYFKTPILLTDAEMKGETEKYYIPIILTAEEANGAEYPHTILWNGLTEIHHVLEMHAKAKRGKKHSQDPKSKHNTDGQEMITAFRKVFISASRGSESLIVFYNPNNKYECTLVTHMQRSRTEKPSVVLECQARHSNITPSVSISTGVAPTQNNQASYRLGFIQRCNEFLQQAYENAEEPHRERSFLNQAKRILESQQLTTEEITLPEGYEMPQGYECFLSPLSLVTQIANECNDNNLKRLLNRSFTDFKSFLFVPIQQGNGTETHLWDIIFSEQERAFRFLSMAISTLKPKKEDFREFCFIFNTQFTREQTEGSTHYYMMIQSKIITKPSEHDNTINTLVKKLIHFVTKTAQGQTTDVLYYAIAQRQLSDYYTTHNEPSKKSMLDSLSAEVINSDTLIEAILTNNLHTVKTMLPFILKWQMNSRIPYRSDLSGFTPLMHAISHRKRIDGVEMVRCLLTHPDIDIRQKSNDGFEDHALLMAISENHLEIVKLLLAHDPSVANIPNRAGETAIKIIVQKNRLPIIELLFQNPKVRFSRKELNEALEIAERNGHNWIASQLSLKLSEEFVIWGGLKNHSIPEPEPRIMLPSPKPVGWSSDHPNNVHAMIDTTGIPKALVLAMFYVHAKAEFSSLRLETVLENAQKLLQQKPNETFFDHIDLGGGSVSIKIKDLLNGTVNPTLYDQEYGQGAAAELIQTARHYMDRIANMPILKKFLLT